MNFFYPYILLLLFPLLLSCSGNYPAERVNTLPISDSGSRIVLDADNQTCQSAAFCLNNMVCNPQTNLCVKDLTCTKHEECGKAAFCAETGKCTPSITGSPCTDDNNCISTEKCIGNFCGCKGHSYQSQRVAANAMILLDRSGSMQEDIADGTKWVAAKQAIKNLLSSMGTQIRFGLAMFPGTNQKCTTGKLCESGKVFIDIGDSTAAQISSFLDGTNTCNLGTPTGETLSSLLTYSGLQDTTRKNFIFLITDGQSNCNDPIPVVSSLYAKQPSIATYAVGFGSGVDPTELNAIATQGGTSIVGGPPYYYVAGDGTSLEKALSTIAGTVLSCTYSLSEKPTDVNLLYLYQNKTLIPRDTTHTNGWDYDSNSQQITIYGAACNSLKAGNTNALTIVYGCPMSPE